jgi:DNA-binding GntR family transcriptional regulator
MKKTGNGLKKAIGVKDSLRKSIQCGLKMNQEVIKGRGASRTQDKNASTLPGTPVKAGVLAEDVYTVLRQEILTLALAPKTRLDENTLVNRFQVSRTPVREALRRLSAEGLVEIRPHHGANVAAIDLGYVSEYFESLRIIQKAVFALAAKRSNQDDFAMAAAAQQELEDAAEQMNARDIPELNRRFHFALAAACRNDRLIALYDRLLGDGIRLSHLPLRNYIAANWKGEIKALIRDHRDMLAALKAGNAQQIAKISDRHVELFEGQVVTALASARTDGFEAANLASDHLVTMENEQK